MTEPLVDLVIAVHTPSRPIDRAVSSVLNGTRLPIRVSVVCHGTDPDGIRARLGVWAEDRRVRLIVFDDGIPSPTGPFNHGIEEATAPLVSIMGSDDELDDGAVDSWAALARRHAADAVIARVRYASGGRMATPPARPFRSASVDGVRDRLSYRSAPLGVFSRRRFGGLRMTPGLQSGEDIEFVTAMWFSGARLAFDRRGPAYVVHDDAADRVTFATKDVATDLGFLSHVLGPVFEPLAERERRALVVKLLRVNLFGLVHNRPDPERWTAGERRVLADAVSACLAAAPGAERVLSRADRALLEAMADPRVPAPRLLELAAGRRRFGRPATILTRELRQVLAREAPLRLMAASALVRAGM